MNIGSSDYDELSEYSYISGEGSQRSRDTLDELMDRFTLDCQPDVTLKLRNDVGPVVLGADLTFSTVQKSGSANLVVKPSSSSALWRRLKLDHTGTLTLRSRKLSWWLLTLDVHGHTNPFTRSTDLSFRLSTKWDVSKGEVNKKKRFALGDSTEGRLHWSVSYEMPAFEGSLGNQQARDLHAELGYAHFSIPKVEVVVWPGRWATPSKPEDTPPAAAAGGSEGSGSPSAAAGSGGSSWGGGGGLAGGAALPPWRPALGRPLAAMAASAAGLWQRRGRLLPWQRAGEQQAGSSGNGGGRGWRPGGVKLGPGDLGAYIFHLSEMAGRLRKV